MGGALAETTRTAAVHHLHPGRENHEVEEKLHIPPKMDTKLVSSRIFSLALGTKSRADELRGGLFFFLVGAAFDPRDISENQERNKQPKLTLMEEILLLGLKDKQVQFPRVISLILAPLYLTPRGL